MVWRGQMKEPPVAIVPDVGAAVPEDHRCRVSHSPLVLDAAGSGAIVVTTVTLGFPRTSRSREPNAQISPAACPTISMLSGWPAHEISWRAT